MIDEEENDDALDRKHEDFEDEGDGEDSHTPSSDAVPEHREPTLSENKKAPKGVVTKHFKTILTVICIVVLAVACFFSGRKKKAVTEADANAAAAQSNASSTDPTRGATQLHS